MAPGVMYIWFAISGHDLVANRVCTFVVHIVRNVVEMEDPVHEVATRPQFTEGRQWEACTTQL